MAVNPSEFSIAELGNIFDQAARSSNREYVQKIRRDSGISDFDLPPVQGMITRSPIVNYAKQILPESIGSNPEVVRTAEGIDINARRTGVGDWLADQAQRLADAQPQLRCIHVRGRVPPPPPPSG